MISLPPKKFCVMATFPKPENTRSLFPILFLLEKGFIVFLFGLLFHEMILILYRLKEFTRKISKNIGEIR